MPSPISALTLQAVNQLALCPVSMPDAPGPGHALVRVHRAGVCGTDYHAVRGAQPFFSFPRVLGHELGVEVLEVGDGVTQVAPGDKCAVEPYLNCGHCVSCRRGRFNCCAQMKVLGVHVDGGMCPYLLVPAAKLHRSDRLGYEQLALVEPLAIGAHAVNRVFPRGAGAGENVLVIGGGPIGLATAQNALLRGHAVVMMDVNAARLAFAAAKLPLHGILDAAGLAAGEPLATAVSALWDGELPTAVFDATGNIASMKGAFHLVAPSGSLCFVGLAPAEVSFYDPDFHRKELTVLATRNALPLEFKFLVSAMETGTLSTDFWLTHRAYFLDAPASIMDWMNPNAGVVKGMLIFDEMCGPRPSQA